MILPVVSSALAAGNFDCEILAMTTAGPYLSKIGFDYHGFKDLVTESDQAALNFGKTLLETNTHPEVSQEESIAYLGLSYADLEQSLGVEAAKREFALRGRYSFLPVGIMKRAINKWKPDVVIATNSARGERAAILAARESGIPALCIVDLFAFDFSIQWLKCPGYASRICVISDFVKQHLVAKGADPGEIAVTGNPAFDRLSAPDLPRRADALRNRRNWGSAKVILWADPGTGVDSTFLARIENELARVARVHPEWRIINRNHPSNLERTIDSLIELSRRSDDLTEILYAVDVVITTVSTVGLQAALLRKPLISIWDPKDGPFVPYAEFGLALGVPEPEFVEKAIIDCLAGKGTSSEMSVPGGAAENVLMEIQSLLKSRSAEI